MGTRYLTLFTQQWEGDITFSLPFSLLNLAKTVVNPSKTDLVKAVGVRGTHTHTHRHTQDELASTRPCKG